MIGEPLPALAPARSHLLVRAARILRLGFVGLAWVLVAPVARVLRRRTPTRVAGDVNPGPTPALSGELVTSARQLPALPPPARDAQAVSARTVCSDFECVVAEPDFDQPRYRAAFAELQRPGSKLLDLRAVRTVPFALFGQLADGWQVGRDVVPKLGIVLDYESWVALHAVAARRLQRIARRGTEIELFYPQQAPGCVASWFAGERIDHPLPAILEWLRAEWHPGASWKQILDTTAMLITGYGHRDQVSDQLLQLAAIALSLRGVDAGIEAAKLVHSALSWIGDTPSRMRCRALRVLASALQMCGETEAALAQLETAIGIAALVRDPIEEASALAELGTHAIHLGHLASAEGRFRAALALVAADDQPYLCATLHHQLASVLCERGKNLDEAEYQAAAALALRWNPDSRLAHGDRDLLARIRARRVPEASASSTTTASTVTADPRNP